MDTNFTPLNIVSFQKKSEVNKVQQHKSFDINVIFISLIIITMAIMAVLLFILIQKKLQELAYVPFFA